MRGIKMILVQNFIDDLKKLLDKHQIKVNYRDTYDSSDEICHTEIYPQFGDNDNIAIEDFSDILSESLGIKVKVTLH
jgi:hypothetical protein